MSGIYGCPKCCSTKFGRWRWDRLLDLMVRTCLGCGYDEYKKPADQRGTSKAAQGAK